MVARLNLDPWQKVRQPLFRHFRPFPEGAEVAEGAEGAKGTEEVDQGEVSTIILGMLESSGFRKYSTLLVIQLFSRHLCVCHCLCIRLCLCICVPYSFLNSYFHKLSENVWVRESVQLLFIQCQGSRRWQKSMIIPNQTEFGLEFSWGWQWSSIFSKPIWIWFGICVLQNSIFSFQTKLELVWKIRRIFWVYLFQTKLDLVWKRTLNEM